jgi:hypothetical protein
MFGGQYFGGGTKQPVAAIQGKKYGSDSRDGEKLQIERLIGHRD